MLVHEVDDLDGTVEVGLLTPELKTLFLRGHTDVLAVNSIAQAAGAEYLVLDHFIPARRSPESLTKSAGAARPSRATTAT
ncbi:MAG: hypothetical protein ACRDRP_04845 [Pseudonocardiaceae bacterium]